MNILITGSCGFIAGGIINKLITDTDNRLFLFSSHPNKATERYRSSNIQIIKNFSELQSIPKCDLLINLAGAPIFNTAPLPEHTTKIFTSRINFTQQLGTSLKKYNMVPDTVLSASATGIYAAESATENSPHGQNFISHLAENWEYSVQNSFGNSRIVYLRFGNVLGKNGGILPALAKMMNCYLGAIPGDGQQFISWVSLTDTVNAVLFTAENKHINGAVNIVSGNPIKLENFIQCLSIILHRPCKVHIPEQVIRFLRPKTADVILGSTCAIPQVLLQAGFSFQDTDLPTLLKKIFSNSQQ